MPDQPYVTLQELESEMQAVRSELQRIADMDTPTDEDLNMQGTLIRRHDELDKTAEPLRQRMADLDRVIKVSRNPENREDGTPGKPEAPTEMFVRSHTDPLEDLHRVAENLVPREDLRARAAMLIEQDEKTHQFFDKDFPEQAYARSQQTPGVAKHVLLTGAREYREAFRAYMENPMKGQARLDQLPMSMRAINLTNASGGYLLPYILDPTIVLTNNSSANPFRRMARIVQTTSNAWQGVNSAGVTAAWIAEATTASDMSPTVGQIQVVPQKAVAWVLGSYESLDDTNFGEQLPGLLSDAKDRLESAAFTTGAGTASNQPLGIMTALGTGSRVAPSATGTAFNGTAATPDPYNLQAALGPRFRNSPGAAFLANIVILNKIRQIDTAGGAQFWTNIAASAPGTFLGQPIYEGSDMNATTTGTSAASGTGSATLLYGDFNQFIVADRVGVSMLYDPMLKGSSNAQLPTGQAGWYMFWRVGSAVSTTAAFRYLTIS